MRIVKLGLISIVVFAVLLFFMSLFFPSTVRVSRAINIYASKKLIGEKIVDLGRWNEWNELYNQNVKVSVISADTNEIVTKWQYRQNALNGSFRMEESANITVLQWYFDIHLKWYPWQKFGSIIFDKEFGPPMESSLHNLKKLVEKTP